MWRLNLYDHQHSFWYNSAFYSQSEFMFYLWSHVHFFTQITHFLKSLIFTDKFMKKRFLSHDMYHTFYRWFWCCGNHKPIKLSKPKSFFGYKSKYIFSWTRQRNKTLQNMSLHVSDILMIQCSDILTIKITWNTLTICRVELLWLFEENGAPLTTKQCDRFTQICLLDPGCVWKLCQ